MRLETALPRRAGDEHSTRRCEIDRACARAEADLASACSAMPPRSCRSWCGAASGPTPSTDQTTAHDPVNGYLPGRLDASRSGRQTRERDPAAVAEAARSIDRRARRGDARFHRRWACRPSITATTSARWRSRKASTNAFDFPGFVPAYIRPLFCRGIGPFRWVALSGDPEDIYRTDAKVKELIPDDRTCTAGSTWRASASRFQGLPARICWVGLGQRHRLGPRLQRDGARAAN